MTATTLTRTTASGSQWGRLCYWTGRKRLRLSRHSEQPGPKESDGWAVREGMPRLAACMVAIAHYRGMPFYPMQA
jgi:hypothetical protein